jgi:hypothetical protein
MLSALYRKLDLLNRLALAASNKIDTLNSPYIFSLHNVQNTGCIISSPFTMQYLFALLPYNKICAVFYMVLIDTIACEHNIGLNGKLLSKLKTQLSDAMFKRLIIKLDKQEATSQQLLTNVLNIYLLHDIVLHLIYRYFSSGISSQIIVKRFLPLEYNGGLFDKLFIPAESQVESAIADKLPNTYNTITLLYKHYQNNSIL